MRPTTRTIIAALLVAGMLVVAGCAGPSASNNSTDGAANGTITTIDPAETPANDSAVDGESERIDTAPGVATLVTFDAVG
ncbi:hypothetical protein [Halomarina oriensis]|uniref:Uncharacterized protein n=1 Tax=Halomarina oriensis TaxID=671145 RepID=A0A6B0GYU7_9EURY|nr:hypothetical protein [Halomarina oriensis]MWG36928.1 hypothetical protein [Halomarina oriensis]